MILQFQFSEIVVNHKPKNSTNSTGGILNDSRCSKNIFFFYHFNIKHLTDKLNVKNFFYLIINLKSKFSTSFGLRVIVVILKIHFCLIEFEIVILSHTIVAKDNFIIKILWMNNLRRTGQELVFQRLI